MFDWKSLGNDVKDRLKYGDNVVLVSKALGIGPDIIYRVIKGQSVTVESLSKILKFTKTKFEDY